jgi:hypothetical protein
MSISKILRYAWIPCTYLEKNRVRNEDLENRRWAGRAAFFPGQKPLAWKNK